MSEEGDSATEGAGSDTPASDDRDDADSEKKLPVDRTLIDRVADRDAELATEVESLFEAAATLRDENARRERRIEELQSDIADRDERIDQLEGRLKRKQADFENYKKRRKRKEQDIRERATEELIERLLDVRDNLVRAIEEEHEAVDGLREGIKMTLREFDRVLDAEGVAVIEPAAGETVDPERHEVMMQVDSEQPANTVAELYQAGYEMAGTVLRPAKVAVSNATTEQSAGDDSITESAETAHESNGEAIEGENGSQDSDRMKDADSTEVTGEDSTTAGGEELADDDETTVPEERDDADEADS